MALQIATNYGILEGKECQDFVGNSYYSFQGIPFAKPPLGKLRFKAPVPPESWTGIRDAKKEQEGCYCFDMLENKTSGQEDCLYLNVYTPKAPSDKESKPKAVMVFIHGGGFTCGSATEKLYGPKHLVTQDIVLVTITYRLGALGFLSLEDPSLEVPGNAGLKDQVMALKWIQQNIKNFGGDPQNVTIFGESAGGACVHFLVMSPMAKGLFHKAIIQSGTVMDCWTLAKPTGMEMAYFMDVNPINESEFLTLLQAAPVEDVLNAQLSMKDVLNIDFIRSFAPIVEKPNKNAFLTENPIDLLIAGKYNQVPIILGYTSKEGMLCKKLPDMIKSNDLQAYIPYNMKVQKGSYLALQIAEKMKKFYFGENEKLEEEGLTLLLTDTLFLRGIHKTAKYLSTTSRDAVYLYRFSMEGKLNVLKQMFKMMEEKGACHGEELGYLFSNEINPKVSTDSIDYKGLLLMIRLWTNFAKNGDPNGSNVGTVWKPLNENHLNFLDIDFEPRCGVDPDKERMDFWDGIYNMKSFTKKY